MARLKTLYNEKLRQELQQTLGLKNINEVPKLTKITLNMGVGDAIANKAALDHALEDMKLISGQKPVKTNARKSVASFKVREGWPIGCKVTLRSERMYEFFDRLVNVALPRVRDFRGLSAKSFDGRGNYNLGVKEQIIFPEIDYDKVDKLRGLDISIGTNAKDNEHAKALLKAFKFPFND